MPSLPTPYTELVDSVLAELENGTLPWRRPWTPALATNLHTGKPYQGVNQLLLRSAALARGWSSPYWITERQAAGRKGCILASEKDRGVVAFAMRWKRYWGRDAEGRPIECWDVTGRRFTVFNFEQTRGIGRLVPSAPNLDLFLPTDAERIALGWKDAPQRFVHPERAFYNFREDRIGMPARESFESDAAFHATLFHELVHATGHESRCRRFDDAGGFGSPAYAFEELVAELGALFLCGEARIANLSIQNNTSYIASWWEVLRRDRRKLFIAAAKAEEACNLILGRPRPAREQQAELEPDDDSAGAAPPQAL